MTSRDLMPFVRLLEEGIGLDAASIGHDEVGRAIRARLGDVGSRAPGRLDEYYRQLLERGDEWDEFVEHVLVPETWFFREPSAFDLLTRLVGERLAAKRACRILSVPCATGEEPYSIALTLHEAGLAAGPIVVDALDLSSHSLAKARAGIFGARSVRYVGPERLARYFTAVEGGHRIGDTVRSLVSFARGNLMDEGLLPRRARYDVIFCRNVLIYFTQEARNRVLTSLDTALLDDGVLISGHAEGLGVVAPRFVSARVPRTFAYVKAAAAPQPPTPSRPRAAAPAPGDSGRGAQANPQHRARHVVRPAAAPGAAAPARRGRPDLAEIERLADTGQLRRALELCQRHLAGTPGSAQGYYLLGVVEAALGHEEEADTALRRAIYLDPGHVPALRYLAGERRRRGDDQEAALLTRRAGLVQARQR